MIVFGRSDGTQLKEPLILRTDRSVYLSFNLMLKRFEWMSTHTHKQTCAVVLFRIDSKLAHAYSSFPRSANREQTSCSFCLLFIDWFSMGHLRPRASSVHDRFDLLLREFQYVSCNQSKSKKEENKNKKNLSTIIIAILFIII